MHPHGGWYPCIPFHEGLEDKGLLEIKDTGPVLLGTGPQGYLAHEKTPPPRTLQKAYAQGHMAVLGGVAVSFERGSPVQGLLEIQDTGPVLIGTGLL